MVARTQADAGRVDLAVARVVAKVKVQGGSSRRQMLLKFGRHWIGVGRDVVVQTTVPTAVRRLLFFWLFREARPNDVDLKARFPLGTRLDCEGGPFRYARAGAPPQVPPAPASGDAGSGRKPL